MRIKTGIGRSTTDLSNQKFGKLSPIMPIGRDRFNKVIWLMLCDCGNTKAININNLANGHAKSCGCLRIEVSSAKIKHGASRRSGWTPDYRTFTAAKERCNNPNYKKYEYYGGRGIQFKFDDFQQFLDHVGFRPEGMTLDRINVNGHYEIGNVRWATSQEQVDNRRSKQEILLQKAAALGGL